MKVKKKRVDVLGLQIDTLTIAQANAEILRLVQTPRHDSYYVVKPYVEFFIKARTSVKIQDILNQADLVLADGISLQWAASYLYGKPQHALLKLPRSGLLWLRKSGWITQIIPERMAGINQTYPLLELCEKHNMRIGVLGGTRVEAQHVKRELKKRFIGIKHLYTWGGYISAQQESEVIVDIQTKNLDILFVAQGFSLQEEFIYRNKAKGLATVMIGEGGTFNYKELGGVIPKAPTWMQRFGLEWLWRLFCQPQRIKRQLAIPKFIYRVYRKAHQ